MRTLRYCVHNSGGWQYTRDVQVYLVTVNLSPASFMFLGMRAGESAEKDEEGQDPQLGVEDELHGRWQRQRRQHPTARAYVADLKANVTKLLPMAWRSESGYCMVHSFVSVIVNKQSPLGSTAIF